jgi:hypothetical protein
MMLIIPTIYHSNFNDLMITVVDDNNDKNNGGVGVTITPQTHSGDTRFECQFATSGILTKVFMVFRSLSRKIPGFYLD